MQKLAFYLKFGVTKLAHSFSLATLLYGIGAAVHPLYSFSETSIPPSLGELRKGPLLLGSAVSKWGFQSNTSQQYTDIIKRNFTVIVAENEMKFSALHSGGRYNYDFTEADKIMDFAVANKLKVRGHTLIWKDVPTWVTQGNFSSTELKKILEEHITTVMTHFKRKYPGVIIAWDVVNEAYNLEKDYLEAQDQLNTEGLNLDHSNNFSASRPIWAKIGQYDANGNLNPNWDPLRDYVRVAYRAAKAADPTVQLFYNDYNSEFMGGRSDEIFRYVRDLKSEGVPIEGMGLETHIGLWAQNRLGDLEANMKRYSDLGLEIHVTEIDVALPVKDLGTGFIPTDPADLNRQASVFGDVATACARNTLCTAILGWGFTYRFSWIPSFFPGMGAATPFDQNYNPTPSWFKLKSIVDAANETNTLKCSVSVQIGNSWKTDTGFSNWLNFYVKATGTQGVNVPWTLRAYNPYYTSVSEYWNWQIRSVNRGTISGVANQSWQGLEPNGTNSVQVGMVVNSLQNSFLPRKITLNGVTCSITNY